MVPKGRMRTEMDMQLYCLPGNGSKCNRARKDSTPVWFDARRSKRSDI